MVQLTKHIVEKDYRVRIQEKESKPEIQEINLLYGLLKKMTKAYMNLQGTNDTVFLDWTELPLIPTVNELISGPMEFNSAISFLIT